MNNQNSRSSSKSIFYGDRQKMILFVVIVLLLGYHFGRPSLEKMLGRPLPKLFADSTSEPAQQPSGETPGSAAAKDSTVRGPSLDSGKKTDPAFTSSKNSEPFELKKIGGNDLQSPAGLIYGMGPNREHRVEHVMRHGEDDPGRPVHSVFDGDQDTILKLLDEAYDQIKLKSKRVKSSTSDGRLEYTVDMQRNVGYRGGQNGKRDGYPGLSKVKLILEDGNRVVTAYPY